MKLFARKKMDFPDDETKRLRRRLAEAEERIKALEEEAGRSRFLQAVVHGVAEPILVIDKNYNILLKNSAADGFWGVSHGMLPKCHEVSHGQKAPCERKDWPCPLRDVLNTGKSVTVTHEHRSAHGPRTYEILASPLTGPSGEIEGIIQTARDITERKKAETLLRESEERFRSIFENSLDAIILSSQDGKYYAANPAACRMLGYSEEELVRIGRDGIVNHSDPNLVKYIEDRKNKGRARAELTLIRKNGTKFPAEVSASVFTDREGRQRASVIMRDITKRKKAEEDLRKYQFILENAGEEFYLMDFSGEFIIVNGAAVKSLGYSLDELLRMNLSEIDPDYDRERVREHFNELKAGDVPAFETAHKAKDGRLITKEVKSVYLEIGGKDYICAFVRDVSERKTLERQRNDFLAMVTHDLKSPLTAILGYSQLLRDEGKRLGESDIESMAEAVNQSGERLLRLVEDFLTISKMVAEKFELRKAPADLWDILQKVERDFFPAADKKGLSISLELPPEPLLKKINIDRAQVERVLGNLVQNAINYTPGGGSITIKAGEAEREGGKYAVVSVSDTGRGIPRDEQEKVFSQYYRSARTAGIKGSGLGLTIAKAVTEAHGGWIELESEPGKGSTFTIFLPF